MRNYSSITPVFTLTAELSETGDVLSVDTADNIPPVPFTLVLNPDTVKEEIVTVLDVNGLQFSVSRAEEGTAPAKVHLVGDKARHMITGRDLQDAQDHIAATENVHGISDTSFLVYTNSSQTLTNKQLTNPRVNENVAMTATSTELNVLDGATITTAELNRLSGVTSNIQSQFNNLVTVPTGVVSPFAGATPPAGWLICDGSAVSRTTYAALFAVLGGTSSPWGLPDSSTFNLPDLRGRAPIGVGTGTGLTTRNLGTTTGTETVTLTEAQMPVHTHSLNPGQVVGTGWTGGTQGNAYSPLGNNPQANTGITSAGGLNGVTQAHPNMQPSIALNFIIKH